MKLSIDEINRRIAEACGWKREFENPGWRWYKNGEFQSLPNYFHCLNACAEMERTLRTEGRLLSPWEDYVAQLEDICGDDDSHAFNVELYVVDATAPQRCHAFLLTRNLIKPGEEFPTI